MLELKAIRALLEKYGDDLHHPVPGFEIGGRPFEFGDAPALVGVINLSPDSWYRESVCETEAAAVERGVALAAGGAALVDIGAESTVPGSERVGPAEQIARLVPVIEALAGRGVRVSAESYYPEVLEAAGEAGACVFNLTGVREQEQVLRLAGRFGAAVVFCYVQGETPHDVEDFAFAEDMIEEMADFFAERTALAATLGVTRCILDPGLGFYYRNLRDGRLRVNHQIATSLLTFRLHRLGFPTMNVLPHAPEIFGELHRRAAEPFFAVLALLGGAHFLRTHELEVVARVREALAHYRGPTG